MFAGRTSYAIILQGFYQPLLTIDFLDVGIRLLEIVSMLFILIMAVLLLILIVFLFFLSMGIGIRFDYNNNKKLTLILPGFKIQIKISWLIKKIEDQMCKVRRKKN